MGSETLAEAVPFKVNVWGDSCDKEEPDTGFPFLDKLFYFLERTAYEHECGSKRGQPLPEFNENGWVLDVNGMYGELITNILAKDGQQIHYVNESQFAAGGGEDTCFFSEERSALEQFCDDLGFDKSKIEASKAVQQTL